VQILLSGRPVISLPEQLQLYLDVQPDVRVLLFTAGVAVVTGVLFGMVPRVERLCLDADFDVARWRHARRAQVESSRRRLLVVSQVALSVIMLSTAGVLVSHLSNLRNLNLGFDRHSVLLVTLDPSRSGYERLQLSNRYRDLLNRLQAIPA
jgi:hypothetical protein